MPLAPRPGFGWGAINWGGPDELRIVLGGLADLERDLMPHPHRRGPQPGAEARAAYGPAAEAVQRQSDDDFEAGLGFLVFLGTVIMAVKRHLIANVLCP